MSLPVEALPVTVRQFVEGHFDTVTAVEVLLLLHRERQRAWSSGDIARRLRIDPQQTENILDGLDRMELVRRRDVRFEYGPGNEDVASAVETLAQMYSRYRYTIINLIFSKRRQAFDGDEGLTSGR